MNFEICYGNPSQFGYGHQRRMQILAQILRKQYENVRLHSIQVDSKGSVQSKLNISQQGHNVIVWDVRDILMPQLESQNQPKTLFVMLDNLHPDRMHLQNNLNILFYDSLPHLQNTPRQNYNVIMQLLNTLTVPKQLLSKLQKAIHKPKIILTKRRVFTKLTDQACLFHAAYRTKNHHITSQRFQRLLLAKQTLITYFGQSCFEALLLNKKVVLTSPTVYHGQLAKMLFKLLRKKQVKLKQNGFEKLIQKISTMQINLSNE